MLNIISKSIYNPRTRGPKKVVVNLIRGLEKINCPYVVNHELSATNYLWIHDDQEALRQLPFLPAHINVLVGPNLFINPEDIPADIDLQPTVYLQPSPIVKDIWIARGYNHTLESWPVGIDTDRFAPSIDPRNDILVYWKLRPEVELEQIIISLKERGLSYKLIEYGKYQEAEYTTALKQAKYIIWLGCYESQGIALEEALASNVPILVVDQAVAANQFDVNSTSAPYFDPSCGLKIRGVAGIGQALDEMERKINFFSPREYIRRNLDLKKQAQDFINIYIKNFSVSEESIYSNELANNRLWRNARFPYKQFYMIKQYLKQLKSK